MRETRIDDMPLERLRRSAERSASILRDARRSVGSIDRLRRVDEALDHVGRLLPGLMDRSDRPVMKVVRGLSSRERIALKLMLLDEELAAHADRGGALGPLAATLGCATTAEAIEAVERVAISELLATEVLILLGALEADGGVEAGCG